MIAVLWCVRSFRHGTECDRQTDGQADRRNCRVA